MTNTTPSDTIRITVADLTMRVDNRVATYKLNGKTYTVLAMMDGWTIPELIESVKAAGDETDLDPWVQDAAWKAGIHLNF